MPDEQDRIDELEQTKLLSEHSKHLTTVATGSILATFAFITKLSTLHWRFLVALAALAFFIALSSALIAHGYLVERFFGVARPRTELRAAFIISYASFCIGVLFLLICILINMAMA